MFDDEEVAMAGIPTKHAHIQFRSRLEATWAAFFTLLGWDWEYEPFDLDGWIPDFSIRGFCGPILVEVKPIDRPDEDLFSRLNEITNRSGRASDEILVCGTGPFCGDESYSAFAIGWFGEGTWWQNALLLARRDGLYGLCPSMGAYNCRIWQSSWGGHPPVIGWHDGPKSEQLDQAERLWARAKNSTQWKRPRRVTT